MLEILVVLVLLALASSVVVPAGSRWLSSAHERAWQQELRAELQGQPLKAFHAGKALRLDAQAVRALAPDMPADVSIELSAPLVYGPTGAAMPAEIRFRRSGAPSFVWRVTAVTGEVQG